MSRLAQAVWVLSFLAGCGGGPTSSATTPSSVQSKLDQKAETPTQATKPVPKIYPIPDVVVPSGGQTIMEMRIDRAGLRGDFQIVGKGTPKSVTVAEPLFEEDRVSARVTVAPGTPEGTYPVQVTITLGSEKIHGEYQLIVKGTAVPAPAVEPGKEVRRYALPSPSSIVRSAVSADGRFVMAVGHNHQLQVWETASGKPLFTRELPSMHVCFSPDSQLAVSAGNDGSVRFWNSTSGGQERRPLEKAHPGGVMSMAFAADGKRLLTGGRDNQVRLWDLEKGQLVRGFGGHSAEINAVALSPDGQRGVSGSWDSSVLIWNLVDGKTLFTLAGHAKRVLAVACSPDSRQAATGGDDRRIHLWDIHTGKRIRTLDGHTGGIWSLDFSADGRRLLSAGSDGTLRVWDTASGQALRILTGHKGGITAAGWLPKADQAVSGGLDGSVRLWDLSE